MSSAARIWLTCGLLTAVAVTLVLLLRSEPEAEAAKGPEAPAPLTDAEVRLYIEIMPQITQFCADAAAEFQRQRQAKGVDYEGESLGMAVQAKVDALLEKRHLTRIDWDRISKRVEYAVNTVRAVEQLEKSRRSLEEQVAMKKSLLAHLGDQKEREATRKEIESLEALLSGKGPPLSERDRKLIRQFWRSLDAATPQSGPPTGK
jgi:hypothetical protein